MVEVSEDTRTTLILVAVSGFLSVSLMLFRLAMRKMRGQDFNLSDYLTMVAIFCYLGRTALTPVVLVWQNNNISASYRAQHVFTDEEIFQREIGGKLTLVNRAVYNTYIWVQKGVVLLLLARMFAGIKRLELIIKVYWVILVATFIPVQVSFFVECNPLHLYWQVVPDPGKCSTAVIQLYVLVALNIFTDLMLIALPMPYLFRLGRSFMERFQLVGLFSIGFGLIIIAVCRLPIYSSSTGQVNRNTLGSIEGFFAAFVANVPTLVTLRYKSTGSTARGHGDSTGYYGTYGTTMATTITTVTAAPNEQPGRGRDGDRFQRMPSTEDTTENGTSAFEMRNRNEGS